MNNKVKFLEIIMSDLLSNRDTLEMELNRIINDDKSNVITKKMDFLKILDDVSTTNNKISLLGEYMGSIVTTDNNNNK
tara:strand:- start:1739 stop:1972 length:234 start_codon:yes stop_codon:yes gene_type:complete